MPKYLFKAHYAAEGVQALVDEGGTARRKVAEQLAESLGGSIESFYFAFGADDAIVIGDLPDDEAAAAVGLAVSATGRVSVETTVLLTPEQIDEVARRSPTYSPPGS